MTELLQEFHAGGIFMYLILVVSLFSLALVIKKTVDIFFTYRLSEDGITQRIVQYIQSDNYTRALEVCNSKDHPLTNILKSALLRANKSDKEIERAVTISAASELPKLRRGTNTLPHLSNIATLLGLLGTIHGLIVAFTGMDAGDSVKRQEALSQGIAIAFRATFFALSVAVILIAAYVFFFNKQNKLVSRMEHSASTVVDALLSSKSRQGAGSMRKAS